MIAAIIITISAIFITQHISLCVQHRQTMASIDHAKAVWSA